MINETIYISRNGVKRKRFKEVLIFFWIISPIKIQEAFLPIFKRKISQEDLSLIIKHHTLKVDVKLYGKDFKELLLSIRYDHHDIEKSLHKIKFTHDRKKINTYQLFKKII